MQLYSANATYYHQARLYLEATNRAIQVVEDWYQDVPSIDRDLPDQYTCTVNKNRESFVDTIHISILHKKENANLPIIELFGCKGINA